VDLYILNNVNRKEKSQIRTCLGMKNDYMKAVSSVMFACVALTSLPTTVSAKKDLPSLESCFNAIRKEVSPDGESFLRLKKDIDAGEWEDLLQFTREYDAGLRGYVLKSAWKQLDGDRKQEGIRLSNSFTFDLIGLNKAGRVKDKEEALKMLEMTRDDLNEFLKLENEKEKSS
jgi:hypothetical protein